jgi:outer membrane PBP1 activator LpoA protein
MESGGTQMMRKGSGTVYRIIVRSELGDRYGAAFEGMQMDTKSGNTVLTGKIIDQPHLYGIIDRINGLGLELLSVQALPEVARPSAEGNRDPEEPEL